ncbi:MAG: VWA domain-containing protein [Chloroflexi bacterium]|nr:MAG: VWA domain-containing protein [Chloroflexota bacterium]
MSFIWPVMLALLLLIPLGVLAWLRLGRRRLARLGALGGLAAAPVPAARTGGVRVRRRITAGLFVLGSAVMVVALARPQAVVSVPKLEGTVILAFDVSGSMAADDIKPTRMAAAKAAARAFVERQPPSVDIGVVAFSDGSFSVQAPTNDQATVVGAINRLAPTRGTSVGQGIISSLTAIAVAQAGEAAGYYSNRASPAPSPSPVPKGTHSSAVIVMLTDGENNQSPDPLEAAQAAADRGVRIYTVGVGSTAGADLKINGFTVHTQLNEEVLRQIAALTDGTYYQANNAADLKSVYDNINPEPVVEPQKTEITPLFAGASLLVLLIGSVASLAWFGRVP